MVNSDYSNEWILAGDLGGTKTLLELTRADADVPGFARRCLAAEHTGFRGMLHHFIGEFAREAGSAPRILAACIAVAGPVEGEGARLTNLPWELDAAEIAGEFAIAQVRLVNDFEAAAWGIDGLDATDLHVLQPGQAHPRGHRVVLGAGTGFGVAYSVWAEHGRVVVAGEGGHAGFAPRDELQCRLWRTLHERVGLVTAEHLLSGSGLERIYDFLQQQAANAAIKSASGMRAPAIAERASQGDPAAAAALDLFARVFGAVAGDHALNVMARGGVYLAGGIAPKILPHLAASGFVEAFRDKGVHARLMERFPVFVVRNERISLLGARCIARTLICVKPLQ
jgi:glucokinase